jgi:hypothetical protein
VCARVQTVVVGTGIGIEENRNGILLERGPGRDAFGPRQEPAQEIGWGKAQAWVVLARSMATSALSECEYQYQYQSVRLVVKAWQRRRTRAVYCG